MESTEKVRTRRELLAWGGLGTAALALGLAGNVGAESASEASALTELEQANVKVVNDFCAAWATLDAAKLGEFFAEDAVFRMKEGAPLVKGKAAIVTQLGMFLKMAKTAEFVVHKTHAIGNIVLDERTDKFLMGTQDRAYHMSGVFYIKDGKIAEWLDYGMPK